MADQSRNRRARKQGNRPASQQGGRSHLQYEPKQSPQQSQQPKPKKPRYKLPYLIGSDPRQFERRFYEQYDESYLYHKTITLLYAIEQGEAFKQQAQAYADQLHGSALTDKYFAALRAELFFMTLHQFEALFALLIAPFQQIPTWIYLTVYTSEDMKTAVRQFLDGDLAALTKDFCHRGEERKLFSEAVYMNSVSTEAEHRSRWDENLDNAAWLVQRVAEAYLANLKAFNSYKHGLRTVIRSNAYFALRPNDADGQPIGSGFVRSSEDALSFLELEETDKGTTVHEKTVFFDPWMSAFYVVKMHQMMETIKLSRLAALRGDTEGPRLNMFLSIDRDGIIAEDAKSRFEFTWQV